MKAKLLLITLLSSLIVSAQSEEEIKAIEKEYKGRDFAWVNEEAMVFKMRKAWTKKWGLFHFHSDPKLLLPMEYDSVSFMSDYDPF